MQIEKALASMSTALEETMEQLELSRTVSLARRKELARVLTEGGAALEKFVNDGERALIAQLEAQGHRFISIEEVADRLDCSVKAVRRGWRAGRYPFIIGDGDGKLVAWQDGMGRWMKERARRQSERANPRQTSRIATRCKRQSQQ